MPVTGLAGLSGGPFGIGGPFGSSISSGINTPQILTPANGAIDQPYTLTITSSAFDPKGTIDTHVSSDWELATDINFVNTVASSTNDTANLTSWPITDIEADVTHYVRVRYKGESPERVSEWSAASAFTTLASFINKPSITSPSNGAQNEVNPVTITSSEFISGGKVTTHVSSDWQVATDANFGNVIRSTTNDTTNLKSYEVTGLAADETYYVRVRYTGGPSALTSEWSDGSSFRMLAVPQVVFVSNTPSSWNPTAGENRSFSVSVTDGANPGAPVTIAYQWYRNGSPVSGATGSTFSYYQPVYYSDNGSNIYCRVTMTNAVGSDAANSNTCSISVNRNINCEEAPRIENINFSGSGGKPGGGTNDWCNKQFSNNTNGTNYTDICGVAWDIDTFRVRARPGRCPSGYDITLEFKIEGNGLNYSKIDKQGGSDGNYSYYGIGTGWLDVNGGNLDAFRFKIIFRAGTQYTQCSDGSQTDIQPEQENNAMGRVSVRLRTYRYDQRP